MKKIILFALLIAVVGCASAPVENKVVIDEDRVLARIDGLKERPSWLKESEIFKIENGTVYTLGTATIPDNNRVEAAYRIAENNAKSRIASSIEQRLEFILQNAEEGTGMDSTQARYIGSEASNLTTSSIRADKVYWEKVLIYNSDGQQSVIYRVFSRAAMPEKDLKVAIRDAIQKRQGKGGLSKDFADKVNQQWDKFVAGPEESHE